MKSSCKHSSGCTALRDISRKAPLVAFVFLFLISPLADAYGELGTLRIRPAAPDFELPDFYGERHRLSELRGSVVLVNFWGSWCPPCRAEMPSLQRVWDELKDENFALLAIGMGDDKATINRFYHSLPFPLTFTLLADRENKVSQTWPVRGIPVTFIVDKAGRLAYSAHGVMKWDRPEILAAIRNLIAERPSELTPTDQAPARGSRQ